MKKLILLLSIGLLAASCGGNSEKASEALTYDKEFIDSLVGTFEARVDYLLEELTLEEKVSQMINSAPAIPRLGIPAYDWWNEALHGIARTPYYTTSFPQAIGIAATWDRQSVEQMAEYVSDEGRAIFNESSRLGTPGRFKGLTYWSPNINIFRDPRWGRGQETYGEDPYLTGEMGAAFVSGIQGNT